MATAQLDLDDNNITGHIDRGGKRLVEITGVVGDFDKAPDAEVGKDFNYKYSLSIDGVGLAGDPVLTLSKLTTHIQRLAPVDAKLTLIGTVHDPLHEIPVGDIISAYYIEADISAEAEALTAVSAEEFLPYAYGRLPDWSAFYRV